MAWGDQRRSRAFDTAKASLVDFLLHFTELMRGIHLYDDPRLWGTARGSFGENCVAHLQKSLDKLENLP